MNVNENYFLVDAQRVFFLENISTADTIITGQLGIFLFNFTRGDYFFV